MSVYVDIKKRMDNFSLDIKFHSDSRRIGILGASGCGKSMTLKSIAGIEKPDEGKITVEGKVFYDHGNKINLKPQKRNVGYLFQNYALFPTMNVEKNIAAGLHGNKTDKQIKVREMIKKFRLEGLEKRLPRQLSGGQQQRVALARIMAYEPDVILLDEPFSALDMFLKDQLQRELLDLLKDYTGTVIMVSHNRDEIYRFSEELLIINQGKIAAAGKTEELFENPVKVEAARLTGCKNFSLARKTGRYTVKAEDWGVTLHMKREIPEDVRWIGYRAHDFIPVWGAQGENMIKFCLESTAVLPFERNYYLRPVKWGEMSGNFGKNTEQDRQIICWFVQRENVEILEEKGLPDYLKFREDKILFLR